MELAPTTQKIQPGSSYWCLQAPVPGRLRAKARGSDLEEELWNTERSWPGTEPLCPLGLPWCHHAAPAKRCRGPGHRHHPRSDLWYVSTQPQLRPASAVPSLNPPLPRPLNQLLPLATSCQTCGAVKSVFFSFCYTVILPQTGREGASFFCPYSFLLFSGPLTHGLGRAVRDRTLQYLDARCELLSA